MRVPALLALSTVLALANAIPPARAAFPLPPGVSAGIHAPAALPVRFEGGGHGGGAFKGHSRPRGAGHHHRRFVAGYVRQHRKKERAALRAQARAPLKVRMVMHEAPPSRVYFSTWVADCEARYASFDPRSGTYLGEDGQRRRCE